MNYQISILPRAHKVLGKLPSQIYERVRDEIRSLSSDSRPIGCKKMVARNGWRIRIQDYRVIYEIDDKKKTITVLDIGHRKDIY